MVNLRSPEKTRSGYCVSKYDGEEADDTEENEARSSSETLGFSFGEKCRTAERTWAAAHLIDAALQMQRDFIFYTTSIRVKVRLCTHEAMADLNTVTTEPCFHLRSCSIFQLLGKKREEEKLPSMFQMNKRLLCAFLPAVSVIVGAECSRIG